MTADSSDLYRSPRPAAPPSSTLAADPALPVRSADPAEALDAEARDASAPDAETPEDTARTPAEYTEPPGSHRRASDGAALDVGG